MTTISEALKDTKQPELLLEVDFGAEVLRYAYRDIAVPESGGTPRLFKGCLMNHLAIGTSFNWRSMTYSSRSVNCEVANKERLQDKEVTRIFDNAIGRVYVWTPGLDWADIADEGLIFSGLCRKDFHTKHAYGFTIEDPWDIMSVTLPGVTIDANTWPSMRTEGYGGSVSQKPAPLLLGEWSRGIPLRCVNTAGFVYLAHLGVSKSADADYTAGTVDVYDKNGSVIAPAGYVFTPNGMDGEGNVCAYFTFTGDQKDSEPLSCSIKGLYDAAGDITGTAGLLIEHPADIVQYLLRNHSFFGDSGSDLESLGTMRNLLPGLKFAALFNDRIQTSDAVNRILSQCFCSALSIGGKAGVVVIDPLASPRGRIDAERESAGAGARITYTDRDDVHNNIRLQYALNPSTGQYEGSATANRHNNQHCKQSYHDYGETPEKTIDCPDIRIAAAANQVLNRLVNLKVYRHELVDIEVPYHVGMEYREGDAAELTVPEGSSVLGTGWGHEKCILIEREFLDRTIRQKWWKVKTQFGYSAPTVMGQYVTIGGQFLMIGGLKVKLRGAA